jgi:DNA-binding response OmpR family regulator
MRVLVVEDEPDLAFTVKTRLELGGLKVEAVASGEEALAAVAQAAPDVIILDLRLPGIDGFDVMRHLRENGMDIPVVVMSAHASEWRIREASDLGSAAYLTKPVDLSELERTVRRVGGDGGG